MSVLVIGGVVVDKNIYTSHPEKRADLNIINSLQINIGGKGLNQAIALAKNNVSTIFSGKLGDDLYYKKVIDILTNEKIHYCVFSDRNYMTSSCCIYKSSEENQNIFVDDRANLSYSLNDFDLLLRKIDIEDIEIVLIQMELDIDIIKNIIDFFYKKNIDVLLDPGPDLRNNIHKIELNKIKFLTPNLYEFSKLTNKNINNIQDCISESKKLIESGLKNIIITLGNKGSLFINEEAIIKTKSFKVNDVDDTGAGDTFNGYFIKNFVTQNKSIEESLIIATAASAVATLKVGGGISIPDKKTVEKFIGDKGKSFKEILKKHVVYY